MERGIQRTASATSAASAADSSVDDVADDVAASSTVQTELRGVFEVPLSVPALVIVGLKDRSLGAGRAHAARFARVTVREHSEGHKIPRDARVGEEVAAFLETNCEEAALAARWRRLETAAA